MNRYLFYLLTVIFLIIPAGVYSQDQNGSVESSMSAYHVSYDKEGKAKFEQADKAAPGDVIEYRILYNNKGKKALSKLTVDSPIPVNTAYVPKTGTGTVPYQFMVSIDSGKTWDKIPVKRKKKMADGTEKEVIIPADQYTHVRWITKNSFAPGEKQEFKYRVKIK